MKHRLKWILGILLMLAAAWFYLQKIAPYWPPCLLWITTGFYCPFCGMTRSLRALLKLRPLTALRCNPLLPLVIFTGFLRLLELLLAQTGRQKKIIPRSKPFWLTVSGMILCFLILRNWVPCFAP